MENLCFVNNIDIYIIVNFVSSNDANVILYCLSLLNFDNCTSSNFFVFWVFFDFQKVFYHLVDFSWGCL